jgi:hypothetical protein
MLALCPWPYFHNTHQAHRHDFVRLAAAAMDIKSQVAGNPAVDSAGRIKHISFRPGDDAAPGVVISSLHDVDFFAQLRRLTDDFPRLARRGPYSFNSSQLGGRFEKVQRAVKVRVPEADQPGTPRQFVAGVAQETTLHLE